MLVIFILTVAACEAAIALALVLMLFHRSGTLDIAVWQHAARRRTSRALSITEAARAEQPRPHVARADALGHRAGASTWKNHAPQHVEIDVTLAIVFRRPIPTLIVLIPALPLLAAIWSRRCSGAGCSNEHSHLPAVVALVRRSCSACSCCSRCAAIWTINRAANAQTQARWDRSISTSGPGQHRRRDYHHAASRRTRPVDRGAAQQLAVSTSTSRCGPIR